MLKSISCNFVYALETDINNSAIDPLGILHSRTPAKPPNQVRSSKISDFLFTIVEGTIYEKEREREVIEKYEICKFLYQAP